MNSEDINLTDSPEILPMDLPKFDRIVVDRLAELQTAIEYRPEIHQQKLQLENARTALGRAKNGELPVLDFTFRYTLPGLGESASDSFHETLNYEFEEFLFGLEFETPIGNRGPRAGVHRAELQYRQAVAALKAQFEATILEVNVAVRRLNTAFDQITPSFEAAEAREREVESIVARAERKDFNTLTTELGARQSLAGARSAIVASIVNYNVAIVNLEWAKGTLLSYNNVVLRLGDE